MKGVSRNLLYITLVGMVSTANAIEPIPDQAGWSGFVTVGVASLTTKSNLIAGVDRFNLELGDKKINSLSDEPDANSAGMPQLNFSLNYTFAGRTQLFLGNSLENLVEFDRATIAGARQQFADRSIVELSLVSSPKLSPVQVWKDPYVTGVKRKETDRTSNGVRLEYDKILGTGFGVQYTQRKIDVDDEKSGTTQLGLPSDQAKLLKRSGDSKRLELAYTFPRKDRHVFKVSVAGLKQDLDGEAMSGNQTQGQLTHVYLGERFTLASNVFVGKQDYDKKNPVFNKDRNDDILGLGFVLFDKKIFNSKNWVGQGTLVWYQQDSNIDFYYQSSTFVGIGAQYRF